MPQLTRKQERLLRRTADAVRMLVAVLTVAATVACVWFAQQKYASRADYDPPEIPPLATWGNIAGIYLPLFAVVAAYVWAVRPAPDRNLAPNGFAMALFRDVFTVVVLGAALAVPVLMYGGKSTIQQVNPFLVWYQNLLTAMVGGAFTYYFHGRINTGKRHRRAGGGESAAPKRKRRRPAAKPAPAPAAEPAPAASAARG